ncbi:MAG: putative toxin-antitoxin system toxin component, PIN family [Bacteroidota bacterium]
MRIILDTNLWISYLISNRFLRLDQLLQDQQLTILFSQELLEEFIEVAQRPKFQNYFSPEDLKALLQVFYQFGTLIEIESNLPFEEDPKDSFLLNLAKDGQADFLITGDKALLKLTRLGTTRIITYTEFESYIDDQSA